MQRLEVSGAVRPLYGSLGVKGLKNTETAKRFLIPPVYSSRGIRAYYQLQTAVTKDRQVRRLHYLNQEGCHTFPRSNQTPQQHR